MDPIFTEFSLFRETDKITESMNEGQFNDPLCYLCLFGAVVSSLSLKARALGSSTAILFIFEKKLSLNSVNSVKTFRENSPHLWHRCRA